jgi:choline-sulfatase
LSRRQLTLAAALLALAAAAYLGWARAPLSDRRPRPSVLLVTLDTLRADRVGAWGGPPGLTPVLDALAARGLVFEEAQSSVPLTLPSHATLLTGLEPPRHGVRDNGRYVLPADLETIATRLEAAGYETGAFVGAYVLDRRFGLARGFDVYDDRITRNETGASVLESQRRGGEVVEAASAWIAQRRVPFFVWAHLYDAHAPYEAPSPFREAHLAEPYDGEVAYVDACVGRLLEAVRAAGRAQGGGEPLVAVVADHGESLGEHGELTHGFFVYQSTLRVPFVLAGPGLPAGERRAGLARTTDLLPTVLGALGLPIPGGLDGIDRLRKPSPRESYAETLYPLTFGWAPLHSFRAEGFKLIDAPRPELYDLASDPRETHDLSRERPEIVERLRRALQGLAARARSSVESAPDAATQERLRSLGYAAAAGPSTAEAPEGRPDPKDRLELYRAFEEALWAGARGERAGAIDALQRLVSREPDNGFFRRSLAVALGRAGRRSDAVAALGRPGLGARDADAWHERALALASAGDAKQAELSERTALALDTAFAEPHKHLGILLARRGQLAEALAHFEQATALDPNDAKVWNNRANALRGLDRSGEAAESYRRAAELAPTDPDPLNGLGTLAVQAGRLQEAVALFRRALMLSPGLAELRLNLAVALIQTGQRDEALREIDTLLKMPLEGGIAAKARELRRELARQSK